MWSVKDTIDCISESVTHIVNLSIESGIVPDKMKIAWVIPLFKSGDDSLFSNIDQFQFCQSSLNY